MGKSLEQSQCKTPWSDAGICPSDTGNLFLSERMRCWKWSSSLVCNLQHRRKCCKAICPCLPIKSEGARLREECVRESHSPLHNLLQISQPRCIVFAGVDVRLEDGVCICESLPNVLVARVIVCNGVAAESLSREGGSDGSPFAEECTVDCVLGLAQVLWRKSTLRTFIIGSSISHALDD